MFGGLLMGGLIGSLLFGGGSFAGPGLLDLLVIGAILFFVVRLLKARRPATQTVAGTFHGPSRAEYSFGGTSTPSPGDPAVFSVPAGFDKEEFLKGAKAAFARLQEAWSKRDLEDIRHFASPDVMKELERQAKLDPTPSPIEIILVDASLTDVRDEGDERTASVYFDVLMREEPGQEVPSTIREIWHFKRIISDPGSHWVLDGIQQVE
jgi:predicted lipid-binding transport protein (Tim44 family)